MSAARALREARTEAAKILGFPITECQLLGVVALGIDKLGPIVEDKFWVRRIWIRWGIGAVKGLLAILREQAGCDDEPTVDPLSGQPVQ